MPPRRSRTVEGSCWQCRKRRVLCDLTRPSCSRCSAAQQSCEYSRTRLKWIDGVAARGKLAGRSVPTEVTPTVPRPVTTAMPEGGLLLYFERAFLPRFNLGIASLDIDLAAVSCDPVLQHAVIALANAHHALDAHNSSDDALFTKGQARLTALESFRTHLGARKTSAEDLFLANVFHCVLDAIIEPTDEAAAMLCHFQGGRALLSDGDCLNKLTSADHGLSAFAISVFATMDLVHSLLSGHEPFFDEAWVMSRAGRHCWWGCLDTEDPFLSILSILTRLARLGFEARESQTLVRIDDLLTIQSALERSGTNACPLHFSGDQDAAMEFQDSWAAFCSAYRATALIYMYRALCNLEPDHHLIQHATEEGVRAICKENLAGNLAHCMLFPILVIGSHCMHEQDRKSLLRTLDNTASYLSFGSIQLIDGFLKERWYGQCLDSDWWDFYGGIAHRTAVF
ncbi:hypothetical protein SLS56_009734 [Neofusicoccum ribis]|uniref:Zn(2)-C6 fungal-type domain-containing protein n=1 Tax=Neofusicoccum ribis TaxID=45134 RepID=A0ABR3SGF6_9PEZI